MVAVWSSGFITGLAFIMVLEKKWMRVAVYSLIAALQLAVGLTQ